MGSNHMHDLMRENEVLKKQRLSITTKQPKRNNEFIVKIKELDIPDFCYQKVFRPKQLVNRWGEMRIEILDLIGENVNEKLNKIITKNGFFDFTNKKLNITITYVGPDGNLKDSWDYKCNILSVEYSPLDYTDDGLMRTILTLNPTSVNQID